MDLTSLRSHQSAIPAMPVRAQATDAAANITLSIDTLVLEGVAQHQSNRVAQALTTELTRLLREQGLPRQYQQAQTVSQLKPIDLQPHAGLSPEQMGVQMAKAIYRGMDQ